MSEHAIRLRAGWEALDLDDAAAEPFRLNLPVDWRAYEARFGRIPTRIQLSRRFGRPLAGAPNYRAIVHLDTAEGVVALAFNGVTIPWTTDGPGRLRAELPALQPRNLLMVEIEPTGPTPTAWGDASIVFARLDDADARRP